MKNINNYILEKFKISSKNIKTNQYNYHPETNEELFKIITQLIKERGEDANLNDIDTSKITNMAFIFVNSKFNGDISKWDVSNVKDMYGMFQNSEFNGDISEWNVSNVKDMKYIFNDCPLEKNPPKWYK